MSKAQRFKHSQTIRHTTIKRGQQTLFSITVIILLIAGTLIGFELLGINLFELNGEEQAQDEIKIAPPVRSAGGQFTIVDNSINSPEFLVGIVSGHKGYDPGAICSDGLSEVDINYTIAVEVVSLLKRRGVQADLLDEYDDRLSNYQANALVSIHSDSCNIPGASGFKIARVTDSAIPEAEDRLVRCLNQEYAAYTDLSPHPASITDGMTNYHAFNEIDPYTPGAIVETGFMLDDRYLLEHKPKIVARGIAAGILCFLELE